MSGAHTQVLIAQTPQLPLKEPSCPVLPESDLGPPVSPQGPLSGLALVYVWYVPSPGGPGCPRRASFCRTLSLLPDPGA